MVGQIQANLKEGKHMSVIQGRKVKDWAVFKKLHVVYNDQAVYPGDNNRLKIVIREAIGVPGQQNYNPEVAQTVIGDSWILVDTYESLEIAKAEVRKIGGEIGLDNVRLLRVVDLHNVLYPIS